MVTRFRCRQSVLGLIAALVIGFLGECHAGQFTDFMQGRSPYYSSWNQKAYYSPTTTAYAPSAFQPGPTRLPDRVAFQGGTVFPSRRALQGAAAPPSPPPYQGGMALPGPSACQPVMPCQPAPSCQPAIACPPVAVCPPANACAPCGPPATQPMVSNFAPRVRYRTTWVPVPVTRYRPMTGTDPATGCPTTSMQPCNSYTWQLRRVPVTQYKPIWSGRCCFQRLWSGRSCFQRRAPADAAPMMAPAMAPGGSCCTTTPAPGNTLPYYSPQPGVNIVPGPASGTEGQAAPTPADQKPTLPAETRKQASTNPPMPLTGPAASAATNRTPPANPASAEGRNQPAFVKPLPDPDAENAPKPAFAEPPQLLDPRERTAMRADWAVVPIAWPTPPPAPQVQRVAAPVQDPTTWDDRGWQSQR